MYVCLCHAVTEDQVRQAVREGASTLRQVQLCLRVGTNCGKCIPAARDLVHETWRDISDAAPANERPRLRVVVSR